MKGATYFLLAMLLTMLALGAIIWTMCAGSVGKIQKERVDVVHTDFAAMCPNFYCGGFTFYFDVDTERGFVFRTGAAQSIIILGRKYNGTIEVITSNGVKTFPFETLHTLVGDPEFPAMPIRSKILSERLLVKKGVEKHGKTG